MTESWNCKGSIVLTYNIDNKIINLGKTAAVGTTKPISLGKKHSDVTVTWTSFFNSPNLPHLHVVLSHVNSANRRQVFIEAFICCITLNIKSSSTPRSLLLYASTTLVSVNFLHCPFANGKYEYTSTVILLQLRRIIKSKILFDHKNKDNSFNDLQNTKKVKKALCKKRNF